MMNIKDLKLKLQKMSYIYNEKLNEEEMDKKATVWFMLFKVKDASKIGFNRAYKQALYFLDSGPSLSLMENIYDLEMRHNEFNLKILYRDFCKFAMSRTLDEYNEMKEKNKDAWEVYIRAKEADVVKEIVVDKKFFINFASKVI